MCKAIVAHVEAYPQPYHKTRLTQFIARLKGVIFAFSLIPYGCGTELAHADSLAADKSSELWTDFWQSVTEPGRTKDTNATMVASNGSNTSNNGKLNVGSGGTSCDIDIREHRLLRDGPCDG